MTEEAGFRACQQCGTPTPASSAVCTHCGAGSPEATAAEAATEYRFFRAVFTRSNQFTMILVGMNLGVFLLEWLAGGMGAMSADHAVLIAFGAKQNALIAEQHQYWRLITCVFLHIGFIHLLMNNYALWIVGRDIEQIYGSARFLILYVVTGVMASISSFYFSPNAVSAGASGAIFGLFGVMATFAFKYRKEIPAALSKDIRRRLLPIIAINLMFGFSARGIVDNAAHVGGLIAGVALALVIPFKHPEERETPLIWRALQVVCIVAVMASFVAVFRSYSGPRLTFSNLASSPGSRVVDYYNRMTSADSSLRTSMNTFAAVLNGADERRDLEPARGVLEKGNPSPESLGRVVAAKVLVDKGITEAGRAPVIDGRPELFRQRLIDLLNAQKVAIERYQGGEDPRRQTVIEAQRVQQSYEQFRREFDVWLAGYLEENGYEMKKREADD
ncbi:MAG: rhomboid family intramembrane serine protease [Acidobacteriota bacterium]